MKETYTLYPIGRVEKDDAAVRVVVFDQYTDALRGLDGFSHIHVFFWFDQNDTPNRRNILKVHPRNDPKNPLTGVFATHAPVRPNLIGVTLCKILNIKDNVILIDDIDAYDGSPVIDIKCYIHNDRSKNDFSSPAWV